MQQRDLPQHVPVSRLASFESGRRYEMGTKWTNGTNSAPRGQGVALAPWRRALPGDETRRFVPWLPAAATPEGPRDAAPNEHASTPARGSEPRRSEGPRVWWSQLKES